MGPRIRSPASSSVPQGTLRNLSGLVFVSVNKGSRAGDPKFLSKKIYQIEGIKLQKLVK